jgi:hypothetical protein
VCGRAGVWKFGRGERWRWRGGDCGDWNGREAQRGTVEVTGECPISDGEASYLIMVYHIMVNFEDLFTRD